MRNMMKSMIIRSGGFGVRAVFVFMSLMMTIAISPRISESAEVAEGLSMTGFVDASYYNNTLAETNTFALDQGELDVEKTIEGAGGLRVDIQHVNTGSSLTTDDILEQGYVWIDLLSGLKLTFGKFNAPIGFELLDPVDMYQYSHAMVFDNGLPTNLTGVMFSGGSGMFDFSIYAANGWDLIYDDNKDKTLGGRLGLTPVEGVNVGLSYITGKEGSDAGEGQTSNLSVMDIDLTITMVENLIIGAEFNSGVFEGMSAVKTGDDATWTGFLVMANYAFTDKVALTLRYDQFHDAGGARLGGGVDETRGAFTVSPSYAVADGFNVLAEYRLSTSDKKTFTGADGKAEDNSSEFAIEFTFSF